MRQKKVGIFAKDKYKGKFTDEWDALLAQSDVKGSYETADVSPAIASIMAVKEPDEIVNFRLVSPSVAQRLHRAQESQDIGAQASMHVMNYFAETVLSIVDEGKKITHEKLAEQVESQLENAKLWTGFKTKVTSLDTQRCLLTVMQVKFDPGLADWCYTPIIQSGGSYDLRPSAQSDDAKLKAGVILCSMGIRYKSYCANIGRTFIIDPHKVGGRFATNL